MENNEWKRIEKELDELINCLLTSNAQMERALSWYADNGNYLGDNGELSTAYKNKMPNKAREALGHLSEPEYPKLTPEQIQERKEAIEWIRNPGGMRWVTGEYDRLYEQLKAQPERKIPCFVNYNFPGDTTPPCRDICAIRGKQMEFSARGISYGGDRDKDKFLKECERLHVEWLDEGKEVENA